MEYLTAKKQNITNYKNVYRRRNIYINIMKYLICSIGMYSVYNYDDDNNDGEGQVLHNQIKIKH